MTIVLDPARQVHTTVEACRSCHAPIYWSLTTKGKRCPYDVDENGEPTRTSHFATCPQAKDWSTKR